MFTSIFFYYHFRGIALLLIPFFSSANIKNFEKQNETEVKKERNKGERADWFWKKQKNRIAYSTSSTSECAGKLPVDWRQCVTALWQLFVSGRFRANWPGSASWVNMQLRRGLHTTDAPWPSLQSVSCWNADPVHNLWARWRVHV